MIPVQAVFQLDLVEKSVSADPKLRMNLQEGVAQLVEVCRP